MKVEQAPISLIKNASSVIGISGAILIPFLKQCEDIRADTMISAVQGISALLIT
ncbi:hypothetical protein ABRQ07_16295 [Pectobacterium polonicum]|uniref:IclR-ED domain-containing protein n=1 Tax=Pectobacterium polonicum TaxID=2485124 RepID=A0ABV1PD98_9GAMM|nr:hypothetical protein [Pectobacterium polonicum]MDC9820144.1 hypothetical protein [Pectobacterium polonicum]